MISNNELGIGVDLRKKEFKDKLNYEAALLAQTNRMANYRDINITQYASSVETFILMCPPTVTDQGLDKLTKLGLHRGDYNSMNNNKLIMYDNLWMFMNKLLFDEGLIYKKSSYQIGLED